MIQEEEIVELFRQYNGGRFDVKRILGIGGMGVVVQAYDKKLKVPRAIKIFNPELLKHESLIRRFENEASIMAGIDHPNIVKVYDVGEIETYHFMVLEWIDGGSLASLISPTENQDGTYTLRPMHPRIALLMIYYVCEALTVAHKRGIIHRDIKPDNILITREGVPKVADFGIAHMDGDGKNPLTSVGEGLVTPRIGAPEQFSDASSVDARSDVYATAVTFWMLMTGKHPPGLLFLHDLEQDSTLLNNVPVCLHSILKKAVSYSPQGRYETMEDFANALKAVEEFLPPMSGAMTVSVDVGDGIGVVDPTDVGATRIPFKKTEAPVLEPTRISKRTPITEHGGNTFPYRPSGEVSSPVLPVVEIDHGSVASVGEAHEPLTSPEQIETEPVIESEHRQSITFIISVLCVVGLGIFFWTQSQTSKIPVPEPKQVVAVVPEQILTTPPPPDVSIAVDVSVADSEPDIPIVVVQIPDEQPVEKPQEKKNRKGEKSSKAMIVKAGETLLLKPEVSKPESIKVQVVLKKISSDDTFRVWLVGPGGKHTMPGSVVPGTYKVVAIFKDQDTETVALPKLEVMEGTSLQLKCDSAREVCWKL